MDKNQIPLNQLPSNQPADKPVRSPCVSICVLNKQDICVGCYRSGNEISHWGKMSNQEKRQILQKMDERAKTMNPFYGM